MPGNEKMRSTAPGFQRKFGRNNKNGDRVEILNLITLEQMIRKSKTTKEIKDGNIFRHIRHIWTLPRISQEPLQIENNKLFQII